MIDVVIAKEKQDPQRAGPELVADSQIEQGRQAFPEPFETYQQAKQPTVIPEPPAKERHWRRNPSRSKKSNAAEGLVSGSREKAGHGTGTKREQRERDDGLWSDRTRGPSWQSTRDVLKEQIDELKQLQQWTVTSVQVLQKRAQSRTWRPSGCGCRVPR